MVDIMKIVKCLEESDLLMKSVSKTVKNEPKKEEGGFLSMLLDILIAILLGNMLTCKGVKADIPGWTLINKGEGIIRAFNAALSFI